MDGPGTGVGSDIVDNNGAIVGKGVVGALGDVAAEVGLGTARPLHLAPLARLPSPFTSSSSTRQARPVPAPAGGARAENMKTVDGDYAIAMSMGYKPVRTYEEFFNY